MAINEINDKYYGYKPKNASQKPSGKEGNAYSGAEEGKTYENLGNRLDRVNPYEFRKGMDYELVSMGCMRLRESTPEEREKATENVLKNLEENSTKNILIKILKWLNQIKWKSLKKELKTKSD